MVKVYYNEEVTDNLGDKKIAIVGYGSQGGFFLVFSHFSRKGQISL